MNELILVQHVRRRRYTPKPKPAPRNEAFVRRVRPRIAKASNTIAAFEVAESILGLIKPPVFATIVLVCVVLLAGMSTLPLDMRLEQLTLGEDGLPNEAMVQYVELYDTPDGASSEEETIPLDLTESFSWETYRVRRGDSISVIAASRSLSMDAIIALNGITSAKRLQEGMDLRIPNMDGVPYTVKRGDSLIRISNAWGIPMETILDANDLESEILTVGTVLFLPGAHMKTEELKRVLGELFIYPIKGRLSSGYGWRNDPFTGVRRFHAAIDLAASTGTPIAASMDGKVSTVGTNSVYGKYIILTHDGGYQTLYAHLNSFSVSKGDRILQGRRIGTVGSTGYSTGPHLHFAVFKNGRALNPMEFLDN